MSTKTISWKEFEQVELRVGTIIEVEDFPEANKPAYKLTVDFGEEIGTKKSSAQITDLYSKRRFDRHSGNRGNKFSAQTNWSVCIGMSGYRILPE